ncbi:MAG: stage II sporulation protein P [Firmicutes bacterium]|jgi:stage II sporulation protein P|nr:stage II sporulation protein P [Bacillota bacterium]
MHKKHWLIIGAIVLFFMSANTNLAMAHEERSDGYFTFLSPQGKVLFQTALRVSIGDEFIAEDNSHYRVGRIEGDNAHCEYLGVATPPQIAQSASTWHWPLPSWGIKNVVASKTPTVAIYHTHSDESYVPTDGTSSIYGQGGIFKVGAALAKALRQLGLNTIHDTTSHDPHDAMSYTRSRRTAAELLKHRPIALFDVHRDAVPRDLYVASVKGQDVTKLTLVIGRENPKIKANLNFAKQLKELNDKENPGLIKGIFLARGGYNQDLFDRALLIEVGTHENSRPAAERAVSLFADTVSKSMGVQGQPARTQPSSVTKRTGSWSAVGWILGLLIISGALYLYLGTGSWQELRSKAKRFVGQELNEFSNNKKNPKGKA